MTPSIYLAGPITGHTHDSANEWRLIYGQDLRHQGWNVLSPLDNTPNPKNTDEVLDPWFEDQFHDDLSATEAVQMDLRMIAEAQVVFVNLHGAERVSIGTMCELGYAAALGKLVVTLGDPSFHDHPFVHELSTYYTEREQDLGHLLAECRRILVEPPYA